MYYLRIGFGVLGVICLIKGAIKFTGSTDSMLNRGAGFAFGDGSGMNHDEVIRFESGLKWLALGGILLFAAFADY